MLERLRAWQYSERCPQSNSRYLVEPSDETVDDSSRIYGLSHLHVRAHTHEWLFEPIHSLQPEFFSYISLMDRKWCAVKKYGRKVRSESGMAELSVLLLTKDGGRDLERLLPALYRQKGAAPFELIAIDSGSTDETLDVLRRFPVRLEQIPAEDFHHARTRNFAASLASGKILIFLSQDAIPASDLWLSTMIANFDDPGVAAVYGRQLPKPGSSLERQDALDAVYGGQRIIKDPSHRNGMGYRFYHFSNVNAAMRRSVWDAVRFPEELRVFEDLGIAKRILDGGWKIVYEPDACVFHSHHHTTMGLFKRYFDIGYTLRRLKIWDAPGSRSSLLRDGKQLLAKKLQGVRGKDENGRARTALAQDIAKAAGLFLGLNQAYIPSKLKRHLSAHQIFE